MKRGFLITAFFLFCALQTGGAQILPQQRLDIPSGQYSGITPLQGPYFAVVHDKSWGGGLHLFTLQIKADGTLSQARAWELAANREGEPGKDNEDVVYVPESGTLWVSAEADASIREYNLEGYPTGRRLEVPYPFKGHRPNAGLEALAYRDSLFWTTTEFPLPGEACHRIQRFSLGNLQAGEQYLYIEDAPEAQEENASTYVHGISAMTALPDGRLAVLEREVYVPAGGLKDKLKAFTRTKIYLTEPQYNGQLLEKTLLSSFTTNVLNIANYEGMCLGPEINGKPSLLLLADSQDGAGGLTKEYLQIILIHL